MATKNHVFTPEGYEQLRKEYQELMKTKRPAAVQKLREARGMGSLEDNLQYEVAKSELEIIDARIAELEEFMRQGNVVRVRKQGVVGVGSRVTVEIEGEQVVYVIVNPYESNPTMGKISYESPVGKELMDRKPGDRVVVNLSHATLEYTVVKVD